MDTGMSAYHLGSKPPKTHPGIWTYVLLVSGWTFYHWQKIVSCFPKHFVYCIYMWRYYLQLQLYLHIAHIYCRFWSSWCTDYINSSIHITHWILGHGASGVTAAIGQKQGTPLTGCQSVAGIHYIQCFIIILSKTPFLWLNFTQQPLTLKVKLIASDALNPLHFHDRF